jgi:hypothetical protein
MKMYRSEGQVSPELERGHYNDPAGQARGRWYTTSFHLARQYGIGQVEPHIYEVDVDPRRPDIHWSWGRDWTAGDADAVLPHDVVAGRRHSERCTHPGCVS